MEKLNYFLTSILGTIVALGDLVSVASDVITIVSFLLTIITHANAYLNLEPPTLLAGAMQYTAITHN